MADGTEKVIGLLMKSQLPLNAWYLKNGVAYTNEADVLAWIPPGSRSDGLFMKIGLELWWFKADLTTLEKVPFTAAQTAALTTILDAASLYDATNVEDALSEVMAYAESLAIEIDGMATGAIQVPYRINFSTASDSIAARVAGATETTDYPTGWVLAAQSVTNLLITHTLTGRKLSGCNIFEIDGSDERLLQPFESAFTGIVCNGLTVLIEGLAPVDLAIRIELLFD